MQEAATKNGRGRWKKGLVVEEENVVKMADGNSGRITRRNARRRPLAELDENAVEKSEQSGRATGKAARKNGAVKKVLEGKGLDSQCLEVVLEIEVPARGGNGVTATSSQRTLKDVPGLPSDYEARLELVRTICEAINAEVEARCEALRATVDIQLPAVIAQLKLQQSKFSESQLRMPVDEFVQQFCSHSALVRREDGSLDLCKNDSMPVDVLRAWAEDAHQHREQLAGSHQVLGSPGAASAGGDGNAAGTGDWLARARRRDRDGDLGEIMAAYIQASTAGIGTGDVSLKSPAMGTPAMWRRGSFYRNIPLSGLSQPGVTPKSERRPKRGEMLLSVNGSPLGHFG